MVRNSSIINIFLFLEKDLKKILFYTPFFSRKDYAFGYGNKPFVQNGCPVTNCFTTNNRNLLSKLTSKLSLE